MQAVLVMIRSDGERRSFSIARDMTVVGRREDCDLRIPLGEVSRKHCRLVRDGDVLRLEDLGSSNGTFHNGERIQESALTAGDTIQVGPVVFVLQIDGVPADEDLQPVAAQEIEGGGTDIGPEVTQPEFATNEGEYAQEGEYASEAEPGTEQEVFETVAAEDEVYLTEQPETTAEPELAEEDFNPLADLGTASEEHEEHHHEEHHADQVEDFMSLETPEPPEEELHLENMDVDQDAQQPNR